MPPTLSPSETTTEQRSASGATSHGKDLRTYLDQLVAHDPNQLMVVDDEVDPVFEAAAIVHKMKNDPDYATFPAVLFRNIKGSRIPCSKLSSTSSTRWPRSLSMSASIGDTPP